MPDIIALGMPVMDVMVLLSHLPTYNHGSKVHEVSWQYGGKVATAVAAASRLGCSCGIVGPVGGVCGMHIRNDLDRHGVDTSRLIESNTGAESPFCLCLADISTGGRSFLDISDPVTVTLPAPDSLDMDYIASGKYLLISGSEPASAAAAARCRERNIPVVIDADGYSEDIRRILPLIDHFIPSEFYYEHIFGKDTSYENNLRVLRDEMQNPSAVVVLTLGERGLAGIDSDGEFFTMPAFRVDVMDTTGAGDVFHGAYIAGLVKGMTVREACRFASASAAIKCTRLGGRAGIPTMEMVVRYMKTGEIDYTEIDERVKYYRNMPFKQQNLMPTTQSNMG